MGEEAPNNIVELRSLKDRVGREREADADPRGPPLHGGGGGGTFDGMEPRVAKLEAAIEHIQRDTTDIKTDVRTLRDNARSDFRLLFGATIAVALGLAALMARGFHWL
jgi:hypothetical protein